MKIRDPENIRPEPREIKTAEKPDLLMTNGGQRLSVFLDQLEITEEGVEKETTIIVNDKFLRRVSSLLMSGHSLRDIALIEGLSPENFDELRRKIPELKDIVRTGKTKGISNVRNALYKKILDPDAPIQAIYQWLYLFGGVVPPNRVDLRNSEGEPLKVSELKPDQRIKRIEELKRILHRCGAVKDEANQNVFEKKYLEKVNKNKEKINKVLEVVKGVSEDHR